jgi:alpha-tubulin suppressor-like RCC1 family protein
MEGAIGLITPGKIEKTPTELVLPAPREQSSSSDADRSVADVASGNSHLVLLTRNGDVCTLGGYDVGQLGRFSRKECEEKEKESRVSSTLSKNNTPPPPI